VSAVDQNGGQERRLLWLALSSQSFVTSMLIGCIDDCASIKRAVDTEDERLIRNANKRKRALRDKKKVNPRANRRLRAKNRN
jgi:hypothetical protein